MAAFVGFIAGAVQAAAPPVEASGQVVEGAVVSYKRRTNTLVLKVGRGRRAYETRQAAPIVVDGRRGRADWLVRGVPVRVTISETDDARGRSRRSRQIDDEPVVESIEIVTSRITGRIRSLDRSGRLRLTPDPTPTSGPAASQPTGQPSRGVRARSTGRRGLFYLKTATEAVVTHQGKRTTFSRLKKNQRVDVVFTPAGRYPLALAINVVDDGDTSASDAGSVRIRIRPDGTVETTRPEAVREDNQRSNNDDRRTQTRDR